MKAPNLQNIIRHPKYPFLDIRDREQYLLAQLYWQFVSKEALDRDFDSWTYWLRPAGYPDGASIFSIRNKDHSKGLVIDQQCLAQDLEEYGVTHRPMVVFTGIWDERYSGQMPYLRIFSAISEDCRSLATHFIQFWNKPTTSLADAKAMIDRYHDDEVN